MRAIPLADILARADIWRGDSLASAPLPGLATGFAALDLELPGGGWPRGGLIELLPAQRGVGELGLLLPALAHLSAGELAWVVCVAPPHALHAPALARGGVDLSRLLVVSSAPGRDAAWTCALALDTEGVGAVVAWLPEADAALLRRLHLAAEESRSLLFVFRPQECAAQASPAPLRLCLTGAGERLGVQILKRRGAPPLHMLSLSVQRPAAWRPRATPPAQSHVAPIHALARPVPAAPAARRASGIRTA
ncbi:translesion DNA synthesis-associated protein ImuA [Rhodocyclus gracilis]|uniref:Translesion DNA synthesis-associated protein ImuA n=1 Tax=Rhodocyclus tenuis TaxID=1066 RepID=A0A6L5JWB3_RHOTE|nr:translesion DNA synthesis-associated protein ImuA [Rhodocyclus gracilis]MQY50914.1 translesion DNA synthesis-associated protein ImuA [Rhodocyclus gracilis]